MPNKDGRFILSGTGSRSLHGQTKLCGHISEKIHNEIRTQLLTHPDLMIMSGGAQGFDFLLAEAAHILGIEYVFAIPNSGYVNYYWPTMTDHQKAVFDGASRILTICNSLYQNGLHSNMVRNLFMIKHSMFMLVYNPTTPGTKHCYGEILKQNRAHKVITI
jgi:uncharacterized phage-like protein YoqJ